MGRIVNRAAECVKQEAHVQDHGALFFACRWQSAYRECVTLRVERQGAVETWTLDRPERANALNRDMVAALGQALDRAYADSALRAVVVAGEGTRVFCAGADLKERRHMSADEVRAFLDRLGDVLWRIDRAPWPVIAAMEGLALGGGFELALACDFRIAAATAELGLPETSLAIIPGAGGTQRLTRLVGEAQAKRLILCAERMQAAEAERLGLLHAVTEGSAWEEAQRWAQRFSQGAPLALAAALEAIDAAGEGGLAAGLAVERRCYERTLTSADRLEALEAFAAKRPAHFRGE